MEAPCSHGSTVEVVDQQTVRYSGGALSASVVVDFAAITGLYPDSLRALAADGHPIAPDAALREHLLARTESGLACLGVHTERCRRPCCSGCSATSPAPSASGWRGTARRDCGSIAWPAECWSRSD